jgi:hypothetical protein
LSSFFNAKFPKKERNVNNAQFTFKVIDVIIVVSKSIIELVYRLCAFTYLWQRGGIDEQHF